MNMKTLLGTAAGLMVASSAYAADLPGDAAPAAVDYVKVCDSFGKGYFNIPGTETCIKIGGRVRAGLSYSFNALSSAASTSYTLYTTSDDVAVAGAVVNRTTYATKDAYLAAAKEAVLNGRSLVTANSAVTGATWTGNSTGGVGTLANAFAVQTTTAGNPSTVTAAKADAAATASVTPASYKDSVNFFGNGRITLDSMSATDLGNLHTYVRFEGDDGAGVSVKQAFIQLGYVTVGRMDAIANGDVMYGDNGLRLSNDPSGTGFGDDTGNGATVMVDNLGGGFYVGAGVYANGNSFWYDNNTNTDGHNGVFQASAGIAKQSWGSFDLSAVYQVYTDDAKYASDYYGVKGTLELALIDKLSARTTATYYHDVKDNDNTVLSLAAKYGFTDSLSVYAGGVYAIRDAKGVDDGYGLQLGADYKIVPDLKLTAEVNYVDDDYTTGGTKAVTSGILRLQREF